MLNKIRFKFFVIFLMFSLVVNITYAGNIDFHVYRDSYKSFETVQLDVSVNNITLSKSLGVSNLVFVDQNDNSINIAKNIVKVNDSFYVFYFDLPTLSGGTYKLGLKNVFYVDNNAAKVGGFFIDLNVVIGNTQILSIRPAYVFDNVAKDEESYFTLILSNKGSDNVDVFLEKSGDFFSFQTNSFSLASSKSKNIGVFTSLPDIGARFDGKINVKYGDNFYEVPFLVNRLGFFEPEIINETSGVQVDLSSVKDPIYLTTLSGKKLENLSINLDVGGYSAAGQIVVNNNAGVDLHDLKYYLSGDIVNMLLIQPDSSDMIETNGSDVFIVSINEDYKFVNGEFDGSLNVDNREDAKISIPIFIRVIGVKEIIAKNDTFQDLNQTPNKTGTVVVEEPKDGLGVFLFFIIILVLIVIGFFVYRKSRKKTEEFESYIDRIKRR